jgi:polyisoprenoid-binding protein YceI
MNNKTSLAYLILIILFSACRGPEVKENSTSVSFVSVKHVVNEKYGIDKKESVVTWKGSNLLAPAQAHTGYAYISKGELMIEKSHLVGGAVEVDMNTIADKDRGNENDLVQHLKSPDFFDVKKFPVSIFVITKVAPTNSENVNITGNLTIKGITHAVTFPAKIEVKSGIVSANGKVIIDRTKWDVRYNSGKFYDNLADKAISDDIEFDMKIVAKKGVRSADQTLESPTSSPTKTLDSVKINPTTANNVEPRATNIIFQSKDDGLTWQDISQGLPENEQPRDFFAGESEIYVRIEDAMYRSKNNLNTPVWEKENGLDSESASIAFDHSGVVEADGVLLRTGQTGIMRSTDHGEHWEWVISEGGVGIAIERIEGGFAAITYNTTTQSRRIRISLDGGKNWKAIDQDLQPASSISSIKQMGKYLICGHPDGIFRSSNMGKTWNLVLPSVDKPEFNLVPTFRSGLNDRRKVFKIYVSGKVLYAVLRASGC